MMTESQLYLQLEELDLEIARAEKISDDCGLTQNQKYDLEALKAERDAVQDEINALPLTALAPTPTHISRRDYHSIKKQLQFVIDNGEGGSVHAEEWRRFNLQPCDPSRLALAEVAATMQLQQMFSGRTA